MKYNVLMEPWIPMADGKRYGLLDALEKAPLLEGVLCDSPLETYAVYRLMIAFVMDALQLVYRQDRFDLLEQGCFDMDQIRAYVARCEENGPVFDLFDEERPFMQAKYDAELDTETRAVTFIMLHIPSGNNHVFFQHHPQASLSPDEALRQMLAAYVFCTAAAQGYPSSVNNTPCIYVLLRGKTLFETLVLNMAAMGECGNIAYGKPAWRSDGKIVPKLEFANVDMLQALTWQPRRITLLCGEDGLVSDVYCRQGHNFKGNALWRDPHVPYRILKSGEYTSLKPQEGRAFWRDLGALAASRQDKQGKPPLVVENAPEQDELFQLSLVGLVTSNAALLDVAAEEMALPRTILEDEGKGDNLRNDLLFLEDCASALRSAAKDFEGGVLAAFLQNDFFQQVHDYVFGEYLKQLETCEDDDQYTALLQSVHQAALTMMLHALEKEQLRMGYDGKSIAMQAGIRRKALARYHKLKDRRSQENA